MVSQADKLLTNGRGLWRLLVGGILLSAFALRLSGLQWDGGYLFHPDERQILVVANSLAFPWPLDGSVLLSPQSPWNPAFFAYGSLPIYLLRVCTWLAGLFDPRLATLSGSYIVGRTLSAVFDVGTVYLTLRLGQQLFSRLVGLIAGFLLSVTVLHIQLSHFYTVDTLLAFFVMLSLSLAIDLSRVPRAGRGVLVGVVWGAALATKASAAPLLAPIALAWSVGVFTKHTALPAPAGAPAYRTRTMSPVMKGVAGSVLSLIAGLVAFVVFQPYAVLDAAHFVSDLFFEGQMVRGVADVPYTRQYIGTIPYLYPVWQAAVWSLGAPLGVTGFAGTALALSSALQHAAARHFRRAGELLVPLSWLCLYYSAAGGFHTKFLRYMLPITPLLGLYAAWSLLYLIERFAGRRWMRGAAGAWLGVVLGTSLLYALAYSNVHRQEHPWIRTTRWLCGNAPRGSTLLVEHWDDVLPLVQGTGALACSDEYAFIRFPFYDADTPEKRERIVQALVEADYVILASNRLYNTIPRLPARYPTTSRYYELLLGEHLGYELEYSAASYPRLLGVELVDDTFSDPPLPIPRALARTATRPRLNLGRADESFTVYDHPKTLVFRKVSAFSPQELRALLEGSIPHEP